MLGKTHAEAGVATALLFSNPTGIVGIGLSAVFGCIGALLPDVDSKNSIASKKLDSVIKVTALASIAIAALLFIVHGRSIEVSSATKINSLALVKVIAFIGLLCISFIGSKTPHRSFSVLSETRNPFYYWIFSFPKFHFHLYFSVTFVTFLYFLSKKRNFFPKTT